MGFTYFRIALTLGLICSIGPSAIDMYLPALPSIGSSLQASPHIVQISLTVFFIAQALSQLLYGPLADILGRKPPLYIGCLLFILASIGCAWAPSIQILILFRLLQGLGAGACNTIPRAIVRDLYSGLEATRLMSLLMLVFSISPMLAPLAGSLIIEHLNWRAIFWFVGCIGSVGLFLSLFILKETKPPASIQVLSLTAIVKTYKNILRDRQFIGLVFTSGFSLATFFIFLSNSSFILINSYHLTPQQYSLAFSCNALPFISAAQLNHYLGKKWGLFRVMRIGVVGLCFFMLLAVILNHINPNNIIYLLLPLFLSYGFLGLTIPVTTVLALEKHNQHAGMASALIGTLQLLCAAAVSSFVNYFSDGSAQPMVMGLALTATLAAISTYWIIPSQK